jgi:hypothetical protein
VLSIDRLIELKGVIKWNAVFAAAGLNPNTMRSAVHHQRDLRGEEVAAILEVLSRYGLVLDANPESQAGDDASSRCDDSDDPASNVMAVHHG